MYFFQLLRTWSSPHGTVSTIPQAWHKPEWMMIACDTSSTHQNSKQMIALASLEWVHWAILAGSSSVPVGTWLQLLSTVTLLHCTLWARSECCADLKNNLHFLWFGKLYRMCIELNSHRVNDDSISSTHQNNKQSTHQNNKLLRWHRFACMLIVATLIAAKRVLIGYRFSTNPVLFLAWIACVFGACVRKTVVLSE